MTYRDPPSLTSKVRAWPKESVADRLERSLAMLFLHGFVTWGEKDKIRRRIGPPPWTRSADPTSTEQKPSHANISRWNCNIPECRDHDDE